MLTTGAMRQAFRDAMAQTGRPLEQLRGVTGRRGPVKEIYRTPSGQTVRLRTNRKRGLMTVADGPNPTDALNFEGQQDFIGIAIPGPRGSVECFLVPSEVAVEALQVAHEKWLADGHAGNISRLRAVRFDGDPQLAWEGFSQKWVQYHLAAAVSTDPGFRLMQVIANSRRAIAAEAGRPESAVSISITY